MPNMPCKPCRARIVGATHGAIRLIRSPHAVLWLYVQCKRGEIETPSSGVAARARLRGHRPDLHSGLTSRAAHTHRPHQSDLHTVATAFVERRTPNITGSRNQTASKPPPSDSPPPPSRRCGNGTTSCGVAPHSVTE